KVPPTVGTRAAKRSTTSVEGVMGYPAEKRAPPANAPSQQASSPSKKGDPVKAPAGSACILGLLFCRSGRGCLWLRSFLGCFLLGFVLESEDCEIRAVHAAKIAAAAFLWMNQVRWVVTLGVEGGRERQGMRGTKLHAEAARLTSLDYDLNRSFSHAVVP